MNVTWQATLVILAALVSVTVAVVLGDVAEQTYAAIVTGALGLGAGAGIHAAGVNTGRDTTTTRRL